MIKPSFLKTAVLMAVAAIQPVAINGAQFIETNGQVVIEAEHFTSKTDGTTHPFVLVPDDAPFDAGGTNGTFLNARGGRFMQVQPDDGQNKGNDVALVGTPPYLEYAVNITTTGEYQLYIRVLGWDGSSDSVYAEIFSDGQRLPAPNPGWYRYGGLLPAVLPMDFAVLRNDPRNSTPVGWTGYAAPEHVDGTDSDVPALFTIDAPGTYTIRISQREDGTPMDALILQLSSLDPPSNPGPDESTLDGFMILSDPVDVRTAPGATATFRVKTSADGTATYAWQKAAPNSTTFSSIPGAVSASYTTGPIQESDFGSSYRVVVTAGGSVLTSRAAQIISRAGEFIETNGRVVIEAEHFTTKVDGSGGAPFVVVPEEAPFIAGGTNAIFLGARFDKFIQSQPDLGGNKGNDASLAGTAPYVEYAVKISTAGEYQLYLRMMGWDNASDSLYAEIRSNGARLPAPNPGWYRYAPGPALLPLDFSQLVHNPADGTPIGWTGYAGAGLVDESEGDAPALFTIPSAGTYTIRLSQREDGVSIDALLLQLSSLDPPADAGPAESRFQPGVIAPPAEAPVISFQQSGNRLTITWINGGNLQEATGVTGPWNSVGTGGSFSTDMTQSMRFYRVLRGAP